MLHDIVKYSYNYNNITYPLHNTLSGFQFEHFESRQNTSSVVSLHNSMNQSTVECNTADIAMC